LEKSDAVEDYGMHMWTAAIRLVNRGCAIISRIDIITILRNINPSNLVVC